MRKKKDAGPGTVEEERQALYAQRRALEELKQELARRVAAVQEREEELRQAVAERRPGDAPAARPLLPPAEPVPRDDARARELDARQRALDEREAELTARAAVLARQASGPEGAPTSATDAEDAQRAAELDARESALARRTTELAEREAALGARHQELERRSAALDEVAALPASKTGDVEARLAELRKAEQAFLRTREELAARAEAVTARERLVADREREVRETEGALGAVDTAELEARLRRLEAQRSPAAAQGFTGGMRRLAEEGTRRQTP